jgi:catechol 2,3-dioxygenase-like lactoylglutathione lyase family enzyme
MLLKERTLLNEKSSSAIVAVRDLDRAREFYGETLGLELTDGHEDQLLEFHTGDTKLVVYVSDFAGTNKANAVVWNGGGKFDEIVGQLRERGVRFEKYPDLGMSISDGVHSANGFKAVWFKDPDGNILHVTNM